MNSHGAGSPPAGAPPHGWPGPPRRPGSGCLSWRWAAGSDRPSCPPKALQLAWEEQSCSTPALMSPRCPWCPPAPLASRGRECWGGGRLCGVCLLQHPPQLLLHLAHRLPPRLQTLFPQAWRAAGSGHTPVARWLVPKDGCQDPTVSSAPCAPALGDTGRPFLGFSLFLIPKSQEYMSCGHFPRPGDQPPFLGVLTSPAA